MVICILFGSTRGNPLDVPGELALATGLLLLRRRFRGLWGEGEGSDGGGGDEADAWRHEPNTVGKPPLNVMSSSLI